MVKVCLETLLVALNLCGDSHGSPSELHLSPFYVDGWSSYSVRVKMLVVIWREFNSRCRIWTSPLRFLLLAEMSQGKAAYYLGHWNAFTYPFHTMNQTISALICTAMAQIFFWCLTLTRATQWNLVYFGLASLSMCEILFLGFCQLDSTSRQVGKQGRRVGIRAGIIWLSLKPHFKCSVTVGLCITLTWLPTNVFADMTLLNLHHPFWLWRLSVKFLRSYAYQ